MLCKVGGDKRQPFLNVVTTGNGQNCVLWFHFSIQSSEEGATIVAKISLYST